VPSLPNSPKRRSCFAAQTKSTLKSVAYGGCADPTLTGDLKRKLYGPGGPGVNGSILDGTCPGENPQEKLAEDKSLTTNSPNRGTMTSTGVKRNWVTKHESQQLGLSRIIFVLGF